MTALLVAAPVGILIGLALGALGAGGSVLAVPALVYLVGDTAQQATTASLVIVGTSAVLGMVAHARAGRVRWGSGTGFGLVGVAGSVLGTRLNHAVDPDMLLLAFAGLILVVAVAMLWRGHDREPAADPRGAARAGSRPPTGAGRAAGSMLVHGREAAHGAVAAARASVPRVVLAGSLVGFLTGFFGIGGGVVVVPALTLALGFEMPLAVGTSLVVIVINSVTSLAARAGSGQFHWALIVPFTVAALAGSLYGNRLTERVPAHRLTRSFAVLLIVVAAYVGARSVANLL